MSAFIALCSLTTILDRVLVSFTSVRATLQSASTSDQLAELASISEDVEAFGKSLQPCLKLPITGITSNVSGVRKFKGLANADTGAMQLSYLGLRQMIVLHALTLELNAEQRQASLGAGLVLATDTVEFVGSLCQVDYDTYWMPCKCSINDADFRLFSSYIQCCGPPSLLCKASDIPRQPRRKSSPSQTRYFREHGEYCRMAPCGFNTATFDDPLGDPRARVASGEYDPR
jgi:hypothetical protein